MSDSRPKALMGERFHFAPASRFLKTAGKTVKGGRLDWESEVEKMLVETAPFIADAGLEWSMAWDEFDTDTGYALGKIAVFNRPPLPAVYPAQEAKMQQLQMDAPATQAVIPVFVEGQKLSNLDIFIDADGMAHRLTERRWNEYNPQSMELGSPDPNAPGSKTTDQYGLPESAAGMDRGMGVTFKAAAEKRRTGFPLLEEVLPHLQPWDQDRMRKVAAANPGMMVGFARARTLPAVKAMLCAPSCSAADYDRALVGTLPTNLIFVERADEGPENSRGARWRAALVSDRYYAPKYVEGDYPTVLRALESVDPGIGRKFDGREAVVQLARRRTANPVVVEDLSFTPERAARPGSYLLMEKDGSISKMDVVQNAYEFDGKASGNRLMCGDGIFAMQPDALGKLISESRGGMSREQHNEAPVPRGTWVSVCTPGPGGDKYTVPLQVTAHGSFMGETYLCGETYRGERVCLRFMEGIASIIPADGVPWPDLYADAHAPMLAPGDAKIVRLGEQVHLMTDSREVEQRLRAYVTFGAKASGTTRMRFDDGESPRYVVVRKAGAAARSMAMGQPWREDDWTVIGRMAEPVTGQSETPGLTSMKVRYILAVLGCSDSQTDMIMSKAMDRGQVTVAGLSPVTKLVGEGGKVSVDFIEKMGRLAIKLRHEIPDDVRERLFKAASCLDVAEIGPAVKKAFADKVFVDRMSKLGSAIGMIARCGGDLGAEKTAEVFAGPESIDVCLGLSILNERTVSNYLRHLPRLKAAEDNMAELVMMARQGLSGVNADDCAEALKSVNEVVESLENLDSKVKVTRSVYPEM